jgi:hypothetical protein
LRRCDIFFQGCTDTVQKRQAMARQLSAKRAMASAQAPRMASGSASQFRPA